MVYLWEKNDDGAMQPFPITLEITSVKVYLDPKNVMPINAYNLRINGKSPEIASDISGLLCFEFSGPPAMEIRNESGTDWSLSVSGNPLLPEEWKDLYVLLDYRIR